MSKTLAELRVWKAGQGLGFWVSVWKAFWGDCSGTILVAAFRTPGTLGSLLPNFGVAAQVSLCGPGLPSSSQPPEILVGMGRPTWRPLGFKTPEAPRTKGGPGPSRGAARDSWGPPCSGMAVFGPAGAGDPYLCPHSVEHWPPRQSHGACTAVPEWGWIGSPQNSDPSRPRNGTLPEVRVFADGIKGRLDLELSWIPVGPEPGTGAETRLTCDTER